ncbi:hypothetical protein [Xenorhabdus bovienii]|uniref:hypothetical protein n=1 Tax=Xenorhabdus bovienii TaxID=40576 RepID=UPI0023B27D12|nr:hypothetical protein [Xenorhabdus bovienii]
MRKILTINICWKHRLSSNSGSSLLLFSSSTLAAVLVDTTAGHSSNYRLVQ